MKQITKTDTRIQQTAYGGMAIVLAVPFLLLGSYFTLAGFGFASLPAKVNGPVWLIGIVGIVFAMCGGVLGNAAIGGLHRKRRLGQLKKRFPSQPWYADYPWNTQGISDRAGGRVVKSFLGSTLFATFLVPFNWWAFFSDERGWMVILVTALFDLLAVLSVGTAIHHALQFLKYGSSHLQFERFPYHPGETLSVRLSPVRFPVLNATLRFVEERYERRGSGSKHSVRHVSYEHYSATKKFHVDPRTPFAPIEFSVPENDAWVNQLVAKPAIRYWELVIEAAQSGVDFRTTFPVPVYSSTAEVTTPAFNNGKLR